MQHAAEQADKLFISHRIPFPCFHTLLFHTSLEVVSRDVGTKVLFTVPGRRERQGSPWGWWGDPASLPREIRQGGREPPWPLDFPGLLPEN